MAASLSVRLSRQLVLRNYRLSNLKQTTSNYSNDRDDNIGRGKVRTGFEIAAISRLFPENEEKEFVNVVTEPTVDQVEDKISNDAPTPENVTMPKTKRLLEQEPPSQSMDYSNSFATMLRKSTLMMLGDLKDAKLEGEIIEVQGDDLYIDFGGKFYCVCSRPEPKTDYYRGRKVDLVLHEWEMTSKFIGSEKHITLLEADATLLGLSKAISSFYFRESLKRSITETLWEKRNTS